MSALPKTSRQKRSQQRQFGRMTEWFLLFLTIVCAVWISTILPSTLPLLLFVVLYVITINFSIPLVVGYVGLTPIVAISSLLLLDFTSALAAGGIGILIAELMRPIFRPIAREAFGRMWSYRHRTATVVVNLLNLILAGLFYAPLNNQPSLISQLLANIPNTTVSTFAPILLSVIYFLLYVILNCGLWIAARQSVRQFFAQGSRTLLAAMFFAVPLSLFVSSTDIGLPALVLLSVLLAAFAIINRQSWHNNTLVVQRLAQFSKLNVVGAKLRETLDLDSVLTNTHDQISALIDSESFYIAHLGDDGKWLKSVRSASADPSPAVATVTTAAFEPDGLVQWVINNNRQLDLDPTNMHYAHERKLKLPEPNPTVWLGVPLVSGDSVIGAMVLQRFENDEPFSLWNHEVLVAIAGQASAAIQNARLHSETVRLYNLTDEALARRLEQLQALLYSITEGVLMIDTYGQIVLINPTAAAMLHDSVDTLHGRGLDVALSAETLGFQPSDLQSLLNTLRTGGHPDADRHIYERQTETKRNFFERDQVPIASDEGRLMGWLMVFRDITEERERSEWRADLTRMIVHDLRNPITTVSSTVDLVQGRLVDTQPEISELLTSAEHGCNTMLEMVDSLMDINRAEAGKFVIDAEAMRLPTLVDNIVADMMPLALQRGVRLSAESTPDLPAIWADEEIVRRMVVNLVDNALKFTPKGGRVHIEMQPSAALATHAAGVQTTIYDDGPGIPPDQKERIFDRFITFNRGGGQIRGTGLGLTFCKLAAEAHEGEIWVEDSAETGSAFAFTLPGIPNF